MYVFVSDSRNAGNFEDKEIIIFDIVCSEFFVILLYRNEIKGNPNKARYS